MNLNFVQMLQDIAQEANFVVTYVDIEELSVSGKIWVRERKTKNKSEFHWWLTWINVAHDYYV